MDAGEGAAKRAQALAAAALTFLAETDDLLAVFLSATGLTPDELRRNIDDLDLQAAVLDFVLMEDAWVVALAARQGMAPARILELRQALPGAQNPHWT